MFGSIFRGGLSLRAVLVEGILLEGVQDSFEALKTLYRQSFDPG